MALRSANKVLLAKVEATPGTAEALDPATDAIRIENPRISPQPNNIQTNEAGGSLDASAPIPGGMTMQLTGTINLRGSGVPGTAPDYGRILQACGFSETLQAASIPVAAASNAAGGTATSFDIDTALEADWSQQDQDYQGLPVELSVNPAAAVIAAIHDYRLAALIATAKVTDVFGTPLDATTDAKILANVLYAPATNNIPSLTMELFEDGKRKTLVGCRGVVDFTYTAGGISQAAVTMTGLFDSQADVAVPAATFDTVQPPVWLNGKMLIDGAEAAVSSLTLASGGVITTPANPNKTEGFDLPVFTARNMTGNIDPLETLIATRDIFADFRAGTERVLAARLGSAVGNRIAFTVPRGKYTGNANADDSGVEREQTPFAAVGKDAGVFLAIY